MGATFERSIIIPIPAIGELGVPEEAHKVTDEELEDPTFLNEVIPYDLDRHVFRPVDVAGLQALLTLAEEAKKIECDEADFLLSCVVFAGQEALKHTANVPPQVHIAA